MMIVLRHEVWSASPPSDYPSLVHEFSGRTEQEAYDAYVAHYEADPVLRTCIEAGIYRGTRCNTDWYYMHPTNETRTQPPQDSQQRSQPMTPAKANVSGWASARPPQNMQQMQQQMQQQSPQQPQAQTQAQARRSGFSPQVIQGGRGQASSTSVAMLPGHEGHDPDVCDVRTG